VIVRIVRPGAGPPNPATGARRSGTSLSRPCISQSGAAPPRRAPRVAGGAPTGRGGAAGSRGPPPQAVHAGSRGGAARALSARARTDRADRPLERASRVRAGRARVRRRQLLEVALGSDDHEVFLRLLLLRWAVRHDHMALATLPHVLANASTAASPVRTCRAGTPCPCAEDWALLCVPVVRTCAFPRSFPAPELGADWSQARARSREFVSCASSGASPALGVSRRRRGYDADGPLERKHRCRGSSDSARFRIERRSAGRSAAYHDLPTAWVVRVQVDPGGGAAATT